MAFGSTAERLAFILELDTRSGEAALKRFGDTADRELGRADNRLDRVGGRMQVAGAGAIAFAGVAGAALMGFARASEEANLATVRLQNSIDNSPELAGESADRFLDLADAIQAVTAADGDAIVAAQAMLGTFHLTGDQIEASIPLIVDYARKFGVDLVTAATQVGKAFAGNIGTLQRNGIIIDQAAYATDRFSAVTDALRENVGGFAEQEGATFSGQLERLKNQLGDVAEGIGTGVVEAVSNLLGPVTALSEKFTELDPATQTAIGKFAAYSVAAVGVVGATSLTIGSLIKMRDNFTTAAAGVASFVSSAGGVGPALLKMAGPAAIVAAAVGAVAYNMHVSAQRAAEAERRTDSYAEALRTATSAAEGAATAFGQAVRDNSDLAAGLAETGFTVDEVAASFTEGGEAAEGMIARVLAAGDAAGMSDPELIALAATLRQNADAAAAAAEHNANLAVAEGDAGTAADEQAGATDRSTEAIRRNRDAAEQSRRAFERLREARDAATGNAISAERADINLQRAQQRLAEANADGEASALDRRDAELDVQEAVIALGEAWEQLAEDQAVAADEGATAVRQAADAEIAALQSVADKLAPGADLRRFLDSYIAQLMWLRDNPNIETRIVLEGIAAGDHPGVLSTEGQPAFGSPSFPIPASKSTVVNVNVNGLGLQEASQQIARDIGWEID